jgi:microcystin-dependent protein
MKLTSSLGLAVSTTEMYSLAPVSVLCNLNTGGSVPHKNSVPKNNIQFTLWANSDRS